MCQETHGSFMVFSAAVEPGPSWRRLSDLQYYTHVRKQFQQISIMGKTDEAEISICQQISRHTKELCITSC